MDAEDDWGPVQLCPVCLSPVDDDGETAAVRTACRHHYHLGCLLKCMEHQGAVCPVCRQQLDVEVAADPRPWMGVRRSNSHGVSPFSRSLAGTPPSGALFGLAATEAAVAVEIAESVRRSLAAEEENRWVTPAAPVHADISDNEDSADPAIVGEAAGPSRIARTGLTNAVGGSRRPGESVMAMEPAPSSLSRRRSMRGVNRWDFPREFRWYAEIAEAVARSLADEAQYLQQGADASDAGSENTFSVEEALSVVSDVVDPRALAGVEEAVLLLHDAQILRARHRSSAAMTAAMSALPLGSELTPTLRRHVQSCQRRAEEHRTAGGMNIADFNVADVVGIARAVLRSLDEDSSRLLPVPNGPALEAGPPLDAGLPLEAVPPLEAVLLPNGPPLDAVQELNC
mmetsp:Transcript_16019/g.29090  ORF Transcript_16019/g.29090 Transcript_16019/m.29090 type:complete len:399 (-) Transcript_16019:111-1307(-)